MFTSRASYEDLMHYAIYWKVEKSLKISVKESTFSEICRLKKWRLLQVFFKDFTEIMCYLPLHFLNLVKLFPPPPPSKKKITIIPGPNLDFLWIWQSKAAPFCENSAKLYFVAKHLGKGLNRGCWSFWVLFLAKKCPIWPISDAALIS